MSQNGRGWTVEELEEAVNASVCLTEVLRRLGLRPAGGNHRSIAGWIQRLDISIDHFDPDEARRAPTSTPTPLAEILVPGSHYKSARLKERLYREGLKHRRCEMCDQGELWHGRRMSLILDHINGEHSDNRLENLRVVCPNCAATLETHCGRKLRAEPRACSHCGASFQPKYGSQRFCSKACSWRAPRRDRGVPRPERRRVERPPYAQLLAEVRQHGFLATGRRYGVSDNAIRKWIHWYEREEEAAREGP